jgi:peptidoglycan hydrolase-like protein with peptidoglycan-binding domain
MARLSAASAITPQTEHQHRKDTIMALTSPRFTGDTRLANVAQNSPPMNWGEVGEPVRLVQQALMDLGFSMPVTTQKFGSPDGIFGDETKAIVRAFQSRNGLVADGVVGAGTLGKLDQLAPRDFDFLPDLPDTAFKLFRFTIAFRSGAMPQVPEDTALANARLVYGQYGFVVDEGPGMSILITDEDQAALDASPTECRLNQEDELQRRLFSLGGGRNGSNPKDILVFYINQLKTTDNKQLNGCASHKAGEPAVAVSASGSPWSMAHEVCHVLMGNFIPTHDDHTFNLLFRSTNLITASLPGLSETQARQMRLSQLINKA